MTERSPHVHELFKNFIITDKTKAVLDFHSGLIRVNCNQNQFLDTLNKPEVNPELFNTFFHEVQHYMQLSFFGYFYNYITIIDGIFTSSLPPNLSLYSDVPETVKNETWLYSIQKDLDRTL